MPNKTDPSGLIPLTPERLDNICNSINARTDDIETRYPALVAACPYEMRLAVAAWVMQRIVEHAQRGGSFRDLIYGRLGFGLDAYVPLACAGGMTISNEFQLEGTWHHTVFPPPEEMTFNPQQETDPCP